MMYRIFVLLLISSGISCSTVQPKQQPDPEFVERERSERNERFSEDMDQLQILHRGLQSSLSYAQTRPELFVKDGQSLLTKQQKNDLFQIYANVLSQVRAIDTLKSYWGALFSATRMKNGDQNRQAFIINYGAWLIQYHHGLAWMGLTVPNETMEKLLDAGSVDHDVPPGTFNRFKLEVIHVNSVAKLMSSHQYFKVAKSKIEDVQCYGSASCVTTFEQIDPLHYGAKETLQERGVTEFTFNGFDIVRDTTYGLWFPAQKGVAQWMGDTKIRRKAVHLISHEQIDEMQKVMEPGDIIVARHNWYLSNVGLPGFWPHAELYLGSPEELGAYFADADLSAVLGSAVDLPTHLKTTFPDAWANFTTPGEGGVPKRLIEAISEGVSIRTLYQGAGADYVGVIRPKRDRTEKARAIVKAFAMWNRPYDFEFDFLSDDSIVCTELVFKAWQKDDKMAGLPLTTIPMMGRATLPANDLVAQYDAAENGSEDLYDFVYFLDGREKEKTAVVADERAFRTSHTRQKWDWVQE